MEYQVYYSLIYVVLLIHCTSCFLGLPMARLDALSLNIFHSNSVIKVPGTNLTFDAQPPAFGAIFDEVVKRRISGSVRRPSRLSGMDK
jgi:hypothetical protein